MKKPSDQFRIDETNELLGQVPGLGFAVPGKQRVTGGNDRKLDSRMQVESTNSAVEAITGVKLPKSAPNKAGHAKLHESGPPVFNELAVNIGAVSESVDEALGELANEIKQLEIDARDPTLSDQEKSKTKAALPLLKEAESMLKNAVGKLDAAEKKLS